MSYGLRITNPSNTLVFSSDVFTYSFHSKPAVHQAGGLNYQYLSGRYYFYENKPFLFRVSLPAGRIPIVAVKAKANTIVEITQVSEISSGLWEVAVKSTVTTTGSAHTPGEDYYLANFQVEAPEVYIFAPPSAPSADYGGRIYDANGVLRCDFDRKLLWFRQTLGFWQEITGAAQYSAGPLVTAQSAARDTSISQPLILGYPNAGMQATNPDSGETGWIWSYGWRLTGSNLTRERYWSYNDKPSMTHYTPNLFEISGTLFPTTAFVIEGSYLD
jgi:hypothetical protein